MNSAKRAASVARNQSTDTNMENQTTASALPELAAVAGSAIWAQYACAALIGEMASISLHDQPHLWRPKQAEYAAEMADAMMVEHAKRFP
tara:strand:+ start:2175 stop:2444 length:270 start_codon:yes stop_codon:yes gene_type:complete